MGVPRDRGPDIGEADEIASLRRQHDLDRRALDVLQRVSLACRALDSHWTIFDALCAELRAVFPLDSAFIALCDLERPEVFRAAMLYDEGIVEHTEGVAFGPITGRMIRERISIIIPDLDEVRNPADIPVTTFGNVQKLSRAWMGVPLQIGPDALGVISLQSYTPARFTEADLDLLGRIAQLVAVALENASLIQHQRRLSDELAARVTARTEELAALGAIAAEMVLQQPLTTMLERALTRILPLLGVRAGNVRRYDRARDVLVLLAQRDIPPDDPRAVPEVPVSNSRIGAIVRENRAVTVERDLAAFALRRSPSYFESLLGIPLQVGDQVIGSMVLLDDRPRVFEQREIDLAQLIGNQMAIAVANARLLEQRDRQIRELSALGAISHAANVSLDLRMLLRQVYAALADLMQLDAFVMSVYDPARDVIVEGIGIDEGRTYAYFEPDTPPTPGSFTAWVLHRRQMLHLRDVQADMARYPELTSVLSGSGRPAASWLGVPMYNRDAQAIGAIVVQSYTARAYDERDERFLERVAQQAALHVQNMALLAQRERQIRELDAIGRIGRLVSASFDLDRMLEIVYEILQQVTGADAFFLVVCERDTHVVRQAFYIERGKRYSDDWPGTPPPPGSLTGWILRSRQPLLFQDLKEEHERLASLGISPVFMGNTVVPRSWAGVPLLAEDSEPIGVISVQDDSPNRYDAATLELLSQVASHLSLGVQKIALFDAEHTARRTADTLREVARVLSSTFHANEVLDLILDQLRMIIAYDSASIMLLEGETLRAAAERGLDEAGLLSRRPLSLSGPSGASLAVSRRSPVVIEDTLSSPDWQVHAFGKHIRAWLGVPLISKGRVLGTLNIDSRTPGRFSARDVEVALAFANHAAVALENAQLYQESVARVEQELEIASRIQSNLFPDELPAIPGAAIAARAIPARETGGDFYDVVPLGGGRFGLLVGDASGKSIPGAMLMAIAHSIARSEARDHELPETVMRETNGWITQDVPARSFVALTYASLDVPRRRLSLANAGQLSPLRRSAAGEIGYLDVSGPTLPLGIREDTAYLALEVALDPGDTIVFYTDGIVEARSTTREMFGFERLEALVAEQGHLPPEDLIAAVLAAVEAFTGAAAQHDDMTMLVLRIA